MFREICQVSYQTITNLSLDSQSLSVNLVENQTNQFSLSDISFDSKKSSFLDMLNSRTEERFSQKTDNNFATSFEKSDSFEKSSNSEIKNNLNEIEDSSVKEMNDNGGENKIQKGEESKKIDESKVSETDKKKSLNVSDENKVAKDEKKSRKDLKNKRSSLDFNKINQIEQESVSISGQNKLKILTADDAKDSEKKDLSQNDKFNIVANILTMSPNIIKMADNFDYTDKIPKLVIYLEKEDFFESEEISEREN